MFVYTRRADRFILMMQQSMPGSTGLGQAPLLAPSRPPPPFATSCSKIFEFYHSASHVLLEVSSARADEQLHSDNLQP